MQFKLVNSEQEFKTYEDYVINKVYYGSTPPLIGRMPYIHKYPVAMAIFINESKMYIKPHPSRVVTYCVIQKPQAKKLVFSRHIKYNKSSIYTGICNNNCCIVTSAKELSAFIDKMHKILDECSKEERALINNDIDKLCNLRYSSPLLFVMLLQGVADDYNIIHRVPLVIVLSYSLAEYIVYNKKTNLKDVKSPINKIKLSSIEPMLFGFNKPKYKRKKKWSDF